jgi:hypothetical protein
MTIAELIAELQKQPDQTVEVSLSIETPHGGAGTNEILEVRGGNIRGWVSSDNEEAYLSEH